MIKYRVHLKGRFGRVVEMFDFISDNDDQAAKVVMEDLVVNHTAELWRGRTLVSRIVGNGVVWQSGQVARL